MIVVLSPAKRLDFEAGPQDVEPSVPALSRKTTQLMKTVRGLSARELQSLMKLSPSLAALNHERFQKFSTGARVRQGTRPAAFAFRGDTYVGLNADELTEKELTYAQDHVRILSGLYGVLRPLDRIQPYRLEMGTALKTPKARSLYEFWGDALAKELNAAARSSKAKAIVNAASVEYFSAVQQDALDYPVVTPVFLEERAGKRKVISFCAKRARGMMARFVVQVRAKSAAKLKDFRAAGYQYREDLSGPGEVVFVRPQA